MLSPPKPNRYKDAFKFNRALADEDVVPHFLLFQNSVEDLLEFDMKTDARHEVHRINTSLNFKVPQSEYEYTLEPQLAIARDRVYAEYAAALDLRSDVHQGILKGGYRKLGA